MKNTLLFTYSTNILVRLLTVNMKNFLNPKIRKCVELCYYSTGIDFKICLRTRKVTGPIKKRTPEWLFRHPALADGPWGRNECMTNEPQRTSAGRLHLAYSQAYSVLIF